MKKLYASLLLLCIISLNSYGQSDCSTALPLCTDANSGGVVNGYGNDDFNGQTVSGCLRNGLGVSTIETNSFWFRVKLAESGEFGFNVIPNDLSEDWDFAVYGPNPTCGALGNPIACNYAGGTGYTGVGLNPSTGTQTTAYDSWMNVNAGDEYVVVINQYDGNNAGFSIEWEGAVIDNNTDPLDCSILVDLGPDRDLCTGQSTVLNATTFGATVSYEWLLFNDNTGIFEPIVPVQNTATLLVSSTGNYQVIVTNITTGEVLTDDIIVTIHDTPIANSVSDIVLCDFNNDGTGDFNLEDQTSAIENGQSDVTVTYHESEIFARAGAVPQSSPYTSGNTTIWGRIENNANPNCYDITSFDLIVTQSPTATQPPNLQACDDDSDGQMIFNLDNQTPIVLGGQTLDITYYEDEANAMDHKGWITNTTIYSTISRTIWVRVEVIPGSDCYALTSFDINVLESAQANPATDILQCDDNNDGIYEFDLNALKDAEILGTQDPSVFEINYFATEAHADANTPILVNPYSNVTPYAIETIWARIQNTNSSDCYDTTSFTIQVFDNATPLDPTEIPILSYCDDNSDGDDTNGFYEFNLRERETLILNGQSPFVFDVEYYLDAARSPSMQISNPQSFTNSIQNGQTIYVRVTNSNPNNVDCYTDTSFEIEVRPLPNALLTNYEFRQCDEDGVYDGITDFNLEEADTFVSLGNTTLNVSYYLTPIDAASGTNPQVKHPFSNNTSSTVYARIESDNGCYRIVTVDLIVSSTTFPPNYSRELITCDDDSTIDGLHVFDLSQTTSEIISLFNVQNLRVGFYRNQDDALSEFNAINPDNAYLSEVPFNQTIWVRVESSTDGGCFGIAPVIQLTVQARPEFELDDTAILCLNNLPLNISTYNPSAIYTYEWLDDTGMVVSQQPSADIIQGGTYTVVATSLLGCESFEKQIVVSESNIADISPDDIQINDNSDNNSITIITENQNLGIGDYEFALDNSNGTYQDSPTFNNVLPGEHVVYVRDKNDCGLTQVTIYVLGFPKFFTPNNDGENDTWQILGVNSTIFPESNISIYDRYGKVMANFKAIQEGWDGNYINHFAPSSDYWYNAQLIDANGNIREYNGHFSLIRR